MRGFTQYVRVVHTETQQTLVEFFCEHGFITYFACNTVDHECLVGHTVPGVFSYLPRSQEEKSETCSFKYLQWKMIEDACRLAENLPHKVVATCDDW